MQDLDIKKVLKEHKDHLEGKGGKRANLSGANLSGAYLYGADLSGANLSGADLSGANLYGADLSGANLSEAYLSGANLSGAYLYGANLYGADLSGAYLSGANLSGAYLYGANLYGANLYGADLSGAYLSGANLSGADLSGATLPPSSIVPETGPFYCFKRVYAGTVPVVISLYVPRSAKRLNAIGSRKCRISRAKVVAIEWVKKDVVLECDEFTSLYNKEFKYKIGGWVSETQFNADIRVECAEGIHCYITKQEAIDHS